MTFTASASSGKATFEASGDTPTGTVVQLELQKLKNAARKPAKDGCHVVDFAAMDRTDQDSFAANVAPGVYPGRYAFVELSSGRRTAFADIPVGGVA